MKTSYKFLVTCLFTLLVASVVYSGCGANKNKTNNPQDSEKPKSLKGTAKLIEEDRLKCEEKGKRIEKLDLNQDTIPDVTKVYEAVNKYGVEKEVLVCRAADLNFDGRKDIFRYFSDEGRPLREELDMDFDGKIDVVNYFENGRIIRQEMDTNFDGIVDIWNYFSEGKLVRAERDSNKDGKPDIWEHYVNGELKRIGYDTNGDGKVDRWERSEEEAESMATQPTSETSENKGASEEKEPEE